MINKYYDSRIEEFLEELFCKLDVSTDDYMQECNQAKSDLINLIEKIEERAFIEGRDEGLSEGFSQSYNGH